MGAKKANGFASKKNGFVNHVHRGPRYLPPTKVVVEKLLLVVKSAVPLLMFLLMYSLNKVLHLLPLLQDLGCVHIHTIDTIEGFLLGCHPHRIISANHNVLLDLLSAVPYLLHYSIPVFFPLYLLLRGNIEGITKFYWLIGWVMWVHYFVWLVFPHTPPWVIDNLVQYNSTPLPSSAMSHREGCAFARIDRLTGLPFFFKMFSGNPIPYGSFPSGHVAWAHCMHATGGPGGNYFVIYVILVAWATLYSCHHYISDVIAALIVVAVTKKVITSLAQKQVCTSDYKCPPLVATCPFNV